MQAGALSQNYPDPLLTNSWLAVVKGAELKAAPLPVRVMEQDLVIWRDIGGDVHAFADRCPHRGARLSLGRLSDGRLSCAYHGWQFDSEGTCVRWPAHPNQIPPASATLRPLAATEAYGLIWVSLGVPANPPPDFPAYFSPGKRRVIDDPVDFAACAPRIVENFLDMAHFPFVHAGVLGAEPHTSVEDYTVAVSVHGIKSEGCRFWQPKPSAVASGGAYADYYYEVMHPTVARLSKLPGRPDSFDILLVTTPLDEFNTRVWKISVFEDSGDLTAALYGQFSRAALVQDQGIVESQSPKRLPLTPHTEVHQRADKLSAAYRRWLHDKGLRYGVCV